MMETAKVKKMLTWVQREEVATSHPFVMEDV